MSLEVTPQIVGILFVGIAFGVLLQRYTRISARIKAIILSMTQGFSSSSKSLIKPGPGVMFLERKKYLGATPPIPGETSEQELLDQFMSDAFRHYRRQCLESLWNYDFESLDSYERSIEANRSRLRGYLGRSHEDQRASVANEEKARIPPNIYAEGAQISRVIVKSRIPNLSFDAYIVKPLAENQLNKIGVVALHGHASSAEKLIGLGREDYGRRLALRLARRGFTVIAPNVTSSTPLNNAISAQAALYGYTLYGIMAQFVQSCIDVLEDREGIAELGTYGISNGALISLFASAIDERLGFTVVASMLSPFYENILEKRKEGSSREYFFYFQGPLWADFDLVQLASLCVPDVLIFSIGQYDEVTCGWEREYEKIRGIYERLGIQDRIGLLHFYGGHEIPEDLATDLLIEKIASSWSQA